MEITLFKNVNIISMDKNNSIYNCMAIYNEKILHIGDCDEIEDKVNKSIKEIKEREKREVKIKIKDLKGNFIVPGFIDTHLHPIITIYYKTQLRLTDVKSLTDLEKQIKDVAKTKHENEWIIVFDLLEEEFVDPKERIFPNRYKLDEIWDSNPLVVFRIDGHICSANSLALKEMEISKETVHQLELPTGGEIQLDDNGEPNGIFTEAATNYILERLPTPSQERIKEANKLFTKELASHGVTTLGAIIQEGEIGFAGKAGALELPFMKYLIKEGLLEQDMVIYIATTKPNKLKRIKNSIEKLNKKNNIIVVRGLKLWADGIFGASTAYMYEPFSDSQEKKKGFLVTKKEDLLSIFSQAYHLGFDIICHAIGDRANDVVIEIFKEIQKNIILPDNLSQNSKKPITRIEHASIINKKALDEVAKHNFMISSSPLFILSEYTWLEKRLGSERIKYTYPFRSIIDSGIILAGASDAPYESTNVLRAIQTCITREGFVPEQSINVLEALKMFTINAAITLGQEEIKGSLEKNKLADFLILNKNILSEPPNEISKIKILSTFLRGKEIYNLINEENIQTKKYNEK